MPCATIHLVLADCVLEDWRRDPGPSPFDVTRRELREAFLHGALAPDMGFIPGTDRFVSELAHYLRPAKLTRALGEAAAGAVDEAFSWGWVTHVLGDVEIHPIVGRAVGERLYGDRARRVDAEEDVATHVSTEVGLDIAFLRKNPKVSRPPSALHFDRDRIRHLSEALTRTYEIGWDSGTLLRGHETAVRMCRRWPAALRAVGWGASAPRSAGRRVARGVAAAPFGLLARLSKSGSPARGFLRPVLPPEWMVREVESVIEAFPGMVREVVRNGFPSIPERNLETGGPAGPGKGHFASDVVARKLEQVRNGETSPGGTSALDPRAGQASS